MERLDDPSIDITPFEIEPYPFQSQILEQLQVERSRGRNCNLVVAATGTGKTIMAGLDYKKLREELPRARLLFVAHRREILEQSQAIFRHILRDGAFGERWFTGHRPRSWEHVFASIQTLSRTELDRIAPDHFDAVIVDEFHHAAASTYEAVLGYLRPQFLLGLTATPERADNKDIRTWFGGRIAVELRLWDALEQELLSPFHYFGIHDDKDLRHVTWRRGGGYDTDELTNIYTADDIWAATAVASDTGRRYIEHWARGTKVLFFVRTSKTDGAGRTQPYFCAGFGNYVSHESERPIAITWELESPLPGDRFAAYRAAVA